MESKEWQTTKLRKPLMEKVQKAVESLEEMHVKKYNSVTEFVQDACILLLRKEGINGE